LRNILAPLLIYSFYEEYLSVKILGFMGSPRTAGLCSKFTESALKGAASAGAEVKQFNLVKYKINYCRGCYKCVYENHELAIGKCPLKDDMAGILGEYLAADGYIMACPVYDFTVTAVMKAFIERRFPMFYKTKGDIGIPDARVKQNFKKKALLIATGSAREEFAEMAEPCFEVMSGHFMVEEVEVIERLYVGFIHNFDKQRYAEKMQQNFALGARLAEEIEKAREL
jgi:multimeric flavodoxin WrbA